MIAMFVGSHRYYSQTRSVSLVPFSAVTGTLGYIAPEILSHSKYDTAVDMWSLGVLLFQVNLLTAFPHSVTLPEAAFLPLTASCTQHHSPAAVERPSLQCRA